MDFTVNSGGISFLNLLHDAFCTLSFTRERMSADSFEATAPLHRRGRYAIVIPTLGCFAGGRHEAVLLADGVGLIFHSAHA